MSENVYCNLVRESDKSGWGHSHCEKRLGRTCPVQEPDIFDNLYWNPTMDPDKSR
jgi:hypothetical protein